MKNLMKIGLVALVTFAVIFFIVAAIHIIHMTNQGLIDWRN